MKTIFDPTTREEVISRIRSLNESNRTQWGKMNLFQMVRHCAIWEAWIQNRDGAIYKQTLLGKVFGKMALRSVLKDAAPLGRNTPTSAAFKPKEKEGDLEKEKERWIALIENYQRYNTPLFIHDFFGKMTREQVGQLAYKHTDHHLRQFNA